MPSIKCISKRLMMQESLIAPNTRASAHTTLLALWCALLILGAAAWSFHFVSFLHAKDLVFAVGLVPATVLQWRWRGVPRHGFRALMPLWYGWVFWTITGFFTAHVPFSHVESAVRFALVLLAASLATEVFSAHNQRQWLFGALIASGVVVGALAVLQYAGLAEALLPSFPGYDQRAYSVFGNQNLLGGYVAMHLTLLTVLLTRSRRLSKRRLILYAGVYGVLLGALVVSATRTAWLAAAVGCAWAVFSMARTYGWRRSLKRWRGNGFLIVAAIGLLLLSAWAPYIFARLALTYGANDVGGHARLWFWAGAARMIADNPLFGVGLGNYGFWSPWHQGAALWASGGESFYHNELHTVHAHSDVLEWLAETGLFGLVFWSWFIVSALRRRNPATPALLALAVFACFNTISHSTPHLLAGLLLAVVTRRANAGPRNDKRRYAGAAMMACVALLIVVFAATTLVPSALLWRAEQVHVSGNNPEPLYLRALAWPWPNPQAHENYAVALLDAERFEEARIQLECALYGRDTGNVHLLLAVCAEARGDREAVARHARNCLQRWPANPHAWALLLSSTPPNSLNELEAQRRRFLKR